MTDRRLASVRRPCFNARQNAFREYPQCLILQSAASAFAVFWDGHMTSAHSFGPSSADTRRSRITCLTFPILTTALIAGVAVGVAAAVRSNKWWFDNLAGPDSSNFVASDQIKKSNVSQLEVAWFYPYATTGFNPIVVDDVIYVLGRGNSLIALDATTGKEIWIHEGLAGITSRGVNYWQSDDGKDRRLLFSINSFLQEIDARTGKTILTFGENGIVDLRHGLARAEQYAGRIQSNSPGKIWKNLLILGSAPGEAFINPPGDIRAYDVITGEKKWQFHTVPLPGEFGYDTWPKEAYKYVGGVNNWGSMSVDEARGIVYIPLGSANYDFYGADRIGQDLFANCILALEAKTGKRLWHFQTVHHDLWDFDNVSAPQLVTVRHNGRKIDAVAHAGKTGFLYVLDRVTGKPLWPIEERPVPKSDVPGEQSWPTQPFPTKPPAFIRQTFSVDDVNPWLATPEQYEAMKERVKNARNEGMFTPPGFTDTISMPGNQGGSNWGTTAADPQKGMVFVVGVNQVAILKLEDVTKRTPEPGRGGGGNNASLQAGFQGYQTSLPKLPRRRSQRRAARRQLACGRDRSDGRGRHQGRRHGRQRADARGRRHHRVGDQSNHRVSRQQRARRPDVDALAVEVAAPKRSRRDRSWRAVAHRSLRFRPVRSDLFIQVPVETRATRFIRPTSRTCRRIAT